jgi:hypothetical protein
MRDFRIDTVRCRIAALAAAMLVSAAPAIAQPISLTPPPPGTPRPAAPAGAPSPAPSTNGGIQVMPLQPVDMSWVGLMNASKGGFPRDLWNGASRSFVATALPQLQPVMSPVFTSLARRLLLSDAVAPSGTTSSAVGDNLLSERIERIYALGFVTDGLALIRSLPATAVTEAIDRDRVEMHFAANDTAGACGDVNSRIAQYPGVWWARALIACQALSGAFAKASLGQSLLADQKAPPDPEFDMLIRLVAKQYSGKIARLGDPTPLRLALLAAAKRPLPAAAISVADPAALAGYASNSTVPAIDRLAAAERAEAFGALPPRALAALYDAISFTSDELARGRRTIRLPADARDRAMLYDFAKSGTDFTVRMTALAALAADAQKRNVFVPMARVLAPTLADIPSVNTDPKFAGIAARILLAAGNIDAAKPWVAASGDEAAVLLSLIAQPGVPQVNAELLHKALTAGSQETADARANLIYALLSALGVDPAVLEGLAPAALAVPAMPGALPNAVLWHLQQQGAQNAELGQTVLASLLIVESGDRLTTEPLLLGRAVAGLHAVGLDADAHALALEAALDAGV